MTVSENYVGLGRAGKRHGYNFSSFPWFSYSALLCGAGVCGKRMRLAGERLAVSQLENSSCHSCDKGEGTRVQTCLRRLVPWHHPHPGVLRQSCSPGRSAGPRALGTGLGTTDAPWDAVGGDVRHPGGPAPSLGACDGALRSTHGGPPMAAPPARQQRLKPKWCT